MAYKNLACCSDNLTYIFPVTLRLYTLEVKGLYEIISRDIYIHLFIIVHIF